MYVIRLILVFKLFILLTTQRVRHTWYSLVMCLVCTTHRKKPIVQVHQFSGVDHKAFKNKRNAEVAFMKFWQIDGGNVQEGSSSSTYPTHCYSSSSTPSTEEIPYCAKDVKYEFLNTN